jgi:hypothetical protein
MVLLSNFRWRIPKAGFEWSNTAAGPGETTARYLVYARPPDLPATSPVAVREYEPMAESGLFLQFAETEPTEEGILGFANLSGSLGGRISAKVSYPVPGELGAFGLGPGELLVNWKREILGMRHAVELWSMQKSANTEGLSRFIYWMGPKKRGTRKYPSRAVAYRGPRITEWPLSFVLYEDDEGPDAKLFSGFTPGDLLGPSRVFLDGIVNNKLKEHPASVGLFPETDRRQLRQGRHSTIRWVPSSLISCLWLQLARAIEGNRSHRQCEQCRKWFETAGEKREDARFCGNPCRFRAYRGRIKEAQELRTGGVSLREIAQQLGSDVKTVKGWVSQ